MYGAYNGYSNPAEQDYGRQQFLTKTYGTMALGLLITFVTAWVVARFFPGIAYNTFVVFGLLIVELAIVWSFSRRVQTASYQTVIGMFVFYAALTGVTFSAVFLRFDMNSIFLCFLMSAAAFGIMALVGHTTRTDLSPLRGVLIGGLIAVLVMSIVGMIFGLSSLEIIVCCAGIAIFLGLTAYDTQKLTQMYDCVAGTELEQKYAVFGALQLYLDFVNLFDYILILFGGRRRN